MTSAVSSHVPSIILPLSAQTPTQTQTLQAASGKSSSILHMNKERSVLGRWCAHYAHGTAKLTLQADQTCSKKP